MQSRSGSNSRAPPSRSSSRASSNSSRGPRSRHVEQEEVNDPPHTQQPLRSSLVIQDLLHRASTPEAQDDSMQDFPVLRTASTHMQQQQQWQPPPFRSDEISSHERSLEDILSGPVPERSRRATAATTTTTTSSSMSHIRHRDSFSSSQRQERMVASSTAIPPQQQQQQQHVSLNVAAAAAAVASTNTNRQEEEESDNDYSEYSEYEDDVFDPEWHARQNQQQAAALLAAAATAASASTRSATFTAKTQSVTTDADTSLRDASIGASSTLFALRRDLREEVDQTVNLMDASAGNYEDPREEALGGGRIPRRSRKGSKTATKRDSFTSNFLAAAHSSLVEIFLDTSDGTKGPSFRKTLSRSGIVTSNNNNNGSLRRQGTGGSNASGGGSNNMAGMHQRRLFYAHDPPPPATIQEYTSWWCCNNVEFWLENLCKFLIILFMVTFIVILAMPQGTYWIQQSMGWIQKNNYSVPDLLSSLTMVDPAQARWQAIQDMILTKGLTSMEDLTTVGTSQYLAARWVSQMDPANLSLTFQEDDNDEGVDNLIDAKTILQRYAMVTLYAELGLKKTDHTTTTTSDPIWNDTKWFHTGRWLSESHICTWHGVDCEDDHRVVRLNLTRNNLHGSTLPSELVILSDLVLLDISYNRVGGSVPEWMDQWQNLEYFSAEHCELGGSLPDSLGNMTTLRELWLSHNSIGGNLTWELNRMTQLRTLMMDYNLLEGSIPPLGNLSDTLERLSFFHNNLTGAIPPELFSLTQLVELNLDDNRLEGTIAPEIESMSRLVMFTIKNNHMTGTLPQNLYRLSNLVKFAVSNNHIRGSIPSSLAVATNLEFLLFDKNPITGTIPASFSNFSEIVLLRVSETELVGSMPKEICDLKFSRGVMMMVLGDCQEGRFTCACCDKCY